ncbi:MAG: DMT family transporter [Sulfurospirillum sp.]|nr:DMT family transporter [Sulfurospirillum sp.]MBL0702505.1 DMT family transporter [Sulfurospirillum sp.]
MLFASFCFAIMGAIAKELSVLMPSLEVVFFRNILGVVFVALTFLKLPIKQIGGRPFLLLFRGIIGFMALVAFFYNIAHISLADAMTFSRTAPIFTTLFAFWFLKEKIGLSEAIALTLGFIGIVFIIKPSGLQLKLTDILGLLSGIGAALAYTSVKELKKYYDTRVIVLSFMIIGTIGSFFLIIFNDLLHVEFLKAVYVVPNLKMSIYIIGLGISSTMAQIYMTKAYGSSKAGVVGAVSYMNILFALIIGLLLGDALPDFIGALGIVLIVSSGILVAKTKS